MGFTYLDVPFDDTPHLKVVSASELGKRNVFIPGLPVSRENTKDCVTFTNHPDVALATALGAYYNGEVPLSFTIWFLPSFAAEVDAYIDQLKQKANVAHDNP